MSLIGIGHIFSSICFILSLKFLSSPKTARSGNLLGIVGMFVAVCCALYPAQNAIVSIIGILLGGLFGYSIARMVQITQMPQLVAGFHALVGLAALMVALCAFSQPALFGIKVDESSHIPTKAIVEIIVGAVVGTITFSASVIACLKLSGKVGVTKSVLQKYWIILGIITVVITSIHLGDCQCGKFFAVSVLLSLVLGVVMVLPIGGADMPVVVSLLNSYSGWANAGIGFTVSNTTLIITGALVGSSGAILSYIMCKAMNRSIWSVIFPANSEGCEKSEHHGLSASFTSAVDVGFLLKNSGSVIIVPGYGMAVAQSQRAVKELTDLLIENDVDVKFAIHPVAGRMPGHMNVLLAEAGIEYEQIFELEEINDKFAQTDVVLVVGANDVTNPAAKTDKSSPIYGMPILDVGNAKLVVFIKRSMSSGYAGVDNALFYQKNTMMLLGDAKKVLEDTVKAIKE